MSALIDRDGDLRRDTVAANGRDGVKGLAVYDDGAPRQLIRLIQAGADLGSDLVQYALDAVDELALQVGFGRMAIVRAIGEALLGRLTSTTCPPRLRRYLNSALLNPRGA